MIEKLKEIKARYDLLSQEIAKPDTMADMDNWRKLVKEHASLEEVAQEYDAYAAMEREQEDLRSMLEDPEMRDLAEEELRTLTGKLSEAEERIRFLLLPKDENDDKNVVMEIRAGTGGEEAALFAADLYRMYLRYAERHGFKTELMSLSEAEMGGIKEVVFVIAGKGAYSRLKYESGVHRVQRVPETESQGRIHTSAATVAVLPEAEDVEIDISPNDIRVDVYRSGGHGGQSVNTTDSAVRITHLETGIVVTCQDEKSQLKNKEKALRVLKSRLLDHMQRQQDDAMSQSRRSQVGSGDRSERIRTYNFPQGRVSDHRINLTLYKLPAFMDGDLDEMIDALIMEERTALLAASGEQ
ncbi:peptide chain release factor 1 [Christensenella sp. MSJ-20]|uniref:peptide chain release factor 1 n=1 Tax=Christensenella sp. MSJ-20 TaxID=2841518 RepID=UPI000D7A5C9F|nr:MAG: peptide chain release factor 1 [Bacillota bacterium]QWT54532.1 peptide chain release factor 1 [Christensenella sp. MSJ-20]